MPYFSLLHSRDVEEALPKGNGELIHRTRRARSEDELPQKSKQVTIPTEEAPITTLSVREKKIMTLQFPRKAKACVEEEVTKGARTKGEEEKSN